MQKQFNETIDKKRFVKPELRALDVKATESSTIPNPTESTFHFPS